MQVSRWQTKQKKKKHKAAKMPETQDKTQTAVGAMKAGVQAMAVAGAK